MSGIAGLWRHGRSEVEPALTAMLSALAHRGPDAGGTWVAGPVGLGRVVLRTTPESRLERDPRAYGDNIVLVADARIDNRDELIALLDGYGDVTRTVPDDELILAAYLKWGWAAPRKLIGDFAFALWDGRIGSLFCARDPLGVKPFFFHRSDRLFAFASEVKGLFALPEVPRELDERQIACYLAGIVADRASTSYRGIERLPAGHIMVVDATGARLDRYWSPYDVPEVRLGSDEEYAEAFRERFTEAVRCRLRSARPVGAALSGGLDSSSIVCMARELGAGGPGAKLATFSAIFPDLPPDELRMLDERRYIEAVVAMGGVEPHYVRADRLSPLMDLDRVFGDQDEAPLAPNLYMHLGLFEAARGAGVRVFLDGIDGDTAVGHGYSRLDDLISAGKWGRFADEVAALAAHCGGRATAILAEHGFPQLDALASERSWLAWGRGAWTLRRRLGVSGRRLLLEHGRLPGRARRRGARSAAAEAPLHDDFGADRFLDPDFVRRVGFAELLRERQAERARVAALPEREQHAAGLDAPIIQYGLEVVDRAAAAYGIEPRYPFFDQRLLEFCLGLPSEQKLAGGWTRVILRRAMDGILPPEVQWRPHKALLSPNFRRGLLERDAPDITPRVRRPGPADAYVDRRAIARALEEARSFESPRDFGPLAESLYTPAVLSLWLRWRESASDPATPSVSVNDRSTETGVATAAFAGTSDAASEQFLEEDSVPSFSPPQLGKG